MGMPEKAKESGGKKVMKISGLFFEYKEIFILALPLSLNNKIYVLNYWASVLIVAKEWRYDRYIW